MSWLACLCLLSILLYADPTSTLYTMKLWHNGQIVSHNGVLEYWGSEWIVIDNCDYDRIPVVELDSIIKDMLHYKVAAVYYVKVPGMEDLQYVEADEQLLKCLDHCLICSRLVEVFCDHPINPPVGPQVSLQCENARLEWTVEEEEEQVENHENMEADSDEQAEEEGETNFRDSPYDQSREDESTNEMPCENLDGIRRKMKGMNVNLDFEEGFVVDDSESDPEVEFGCKKFRR